MQSNIEKSPDRIEIETTRARGAEARGIVIRILTASLVLALVAFAVVFLAFFTKS